MQRSAAFLAEVSSEFHFCHIGGKRERQQAGWLQGSGAPWLNMDEKHHIHPPSKKNTKKQPDVVPVTQMSSTDSIYLN